jgi:Fe-S cluster assembly protein SufD
MPESMMQPNLQGLGPVEGVRAAALARWQDRGWPGPKDESWRFTRLSSLAKMELQPAAANGALTPADMPQLDGLPDAAHVIRFHNGVMVSTATDGLPTAITSRQLDDDDLASLMALLPSGHPVTDLSLAAMTSGLCLEVAPGAKVKTPIILVFSGDDSALSTHPAVLLRLGRGAQAVVAEWHQSAVGLAAPVLGVDIGDEARLDYAKIQSEGAATTHLAATGIKMGENAVLDGFQLSVGGRLARLEAHVMLAAEKSDCRLSAIYLGRGNQHHDITTNMTHAKGHCQSNQVIRGVLDDAARGVFQGKVHVAQDAQKTDGQQMSRALLLSRKAEADAKPELEIYADDVICAHGATVGELDETQLFYLTSRGITRALAKSMLISAFLDDAIDMVENTDLADLLRPHVSGWMQSLKGGVDG